MACVQTGAAPESIYGIFVETCPRIFPAIQVSHPIGNIHVDSVNPRCGNFAHALHVSFPPFYGVWADPHILITWPDPKGGTGSKYRGLAGDLSLQPIGMIF